jgi:hypothetical protein
MEEVKKPEANSRNDKTGTAGLANFATNHTFVKAIYSSTNARNTISIARQRKIFSRKLKPEMIERQGHCRALSARSLCARPRLCHIAKKRPIPAAKTRPN